MSGMISRAVTASRAAGIEMRTRLWRPHTRLFLLEDVPGWVISRELNSIQQVFTDLGVRCPPAAWATRARDQCLFFGSHFKALRRPWPGLRPRVAMAYFHGRPGIHDEAEFTEDLETLLACKDRIQRVQVSHLEMYELLVDAGFPEDRVFRIPIGIEIDLFTRRTAESCVRARSDFGLPQSAVIVGSFQKDGVGWGGGTEPKLIKGPDVLVEVLGRVRHRIPELFVALAGPARGFVRAGLERLGIPYKSFELEDYSDVARLYHALDAYVVTSRQEGGPKAVLESMASGVPLITTRVGQAMDLVEHEVNGWMVEVEDVEALAHWTVRVLESADSLGTVLERARALAEANSYALQRPLWADFLDGFVEGVERA